MRRRYLFRAITRRMEDAQPFSYRNAAIPASLLHAYAYPEIFRTRSLVRTILDVWRPRSHCGRQL